MGWQTLPTKGGSNGGGSLSCGLNLVQTASWQGWIFQYGRVLFQWAKLGERTAQGLEARNRIFQTDKHRLCSSVTSPPVWQSGPCHHGFWVIQAALLSPEKMWRFQTSGHLEVPGTKTVLKRYTARGAVKTLTYRQNVMNKNGGVYLHGTTILDPA